MRLDSSSVSEKIDVVCRFFLDKPLPVSRLVFMTTQKATCNCFNSDCCDRRRAKGLVPFCEMKPAPIVSVNDGYFDTIQEAYAAHPGKRVGLISGGIGTGSPPRFGLRWSANAQ